VIWLDNSFADFTNLPIEEVSTFTPLDFYNSESTSDSVTSNSVFHYHPPRDPEPINDPEFLEPVAPRTPRIRGLDREIRNLTTSYNSDPASLMEPPHTESDWSILCSHRCEGV
jgi:hypothetical protein